MENLGAPKRWLPPKDLKPFVGRATQKSTRRSATPIKDEQLLELFEELTDPNWRFAIGLMACFGLRPVELRYCRPEGEKLWVDYSKRTGRGLTEPAFVQGLDPFGLDGESQRLLVQFRNHTVEFPPLGFVDGVVGQRIGQYLMHRLTWKSLKQELERKGEKLTPYSFRHGFALRAHQRYGLSPRAAARLMRHSPQTHLSHYGRWIDNEELEAAVQRGYEKALNQDQQLK